MKGPTDELATSQAGRGPGFLRQLSNRAVEEGSGFPSPGSPGVQNKSSEGGTWIAVVFGPLPARDGLEGS